ncbi:MAG TPA: hypothetical protein VGK32_15725 [Vicinamibacterales bacterium]
MKNDGWAMSAQGLFLFLFIPLVLFLFLRQPFGPAWSVGLGLAVMFGHRIVAMPWVAKFADVRCLWCGRVGVNVRLPVESGGRTWSMAACSEAHAASVTRFLAFVVRHRYLIAIGIFVPLLVLLGNSLVTAVGRPLLSHDHVAVFFRVTVALTVVAASVGSLLRSPVSVPVPVTGASSAILGAPGEEAPGLRCPFPIHNLALLGIGRTLWVFRLVGAWWIADAVWRLWNW